MPFNPTDPNPDIAGLTRVRNASGMLVNYGQGDGATYDDEGVFFNCWAGEPHGLFGTTSCPGPGPSSASLAATFHTDPSYWTVPGIPPPLDLDPQPAYALVVLGLSLRFSPYPDGCQSGGSPDAGVPVHADEDGFGCATVYNGTSEATITPAFVTGATFEWQPWSGWDTATYDPGRDPAYDTTSGSEWSQRGAAFIAPPSAVYTDPDPLDPNIGYAPFLWRWENVLDQTAMVDATGDIWHRIRIGATAAYALTLTIYPYLGPVPAPSRWMHVL